MPFLDFDFDKRSKYEVAPIFEEEPPVDHISPAKKRLNNQNEPVPYEEATPSYNTIRMKYVLKFVNDLAWLELTLEERIEAH